MTDYDRVKDVLEGGIKDRECLHDLLIENWFDIAVSKYSLEIYPLKYDKVLKNFVPSVPDWVITTLGLYIILEYIRRERSRINKLQNIVGRDISLNSTNSSKTATKEEFDSVYKEIEELIHKQKRHAYN